ncbi:uncharacterized protein JCM6883_004419 [Sporobolomyces salmoneus]|uniref:uncharacterized protein n=1 Tax=Sporobolomyces salmoneus TaxID=183962 RepID=UPI0031710E06
MTSIATLGYGLTVRATDLLTAAQAWPHLEPTFRFFDLLFLRKRNGTLTSRGKLRGLIEEVPVEVWEKIRKGVVRRGMIDAENSFLSLPEYLFEGTGFPDKFNNLKRGYDDGIAEAIHQLVAAFGLAHPLGRFITLDPQEWYSLDDVALVTIPNRVRRNDSSYPTISAEAGYDEQDEHTLVNVSLDLPRNANLRFLRFVRTFNLQVVEVSQSTLHCVAPSLEPKNDSRKGLAGIEQEEVKNVKEVKPRWILYTSCWGDW